MVLKHLMPGMVYTFEVRAVSGVASRLCLDSLSHRLNATLERYARSIT